MNHEESVRWNGWSGELGYRLLGRAYGVLRVWSGVGSGSAGRLRPPRSRSGVADWDIQTDRGPLGTGARPCAASGVTPWTKTWTSGAAGIGAEPANGGRPQPTGGGRGDGFGPRRRGSLTASPTLSSSHAVVRGSAVAGAAGSPATRSAGACGRPGVAGGLAKLVMVRYCERMSRRAMAALWRVSGLILVWSAAGRGRSVATLSRGGSSVA